MCDVRCAMWIFGLAIAMVLEPPWRAFWRLTRARRIPPQMIDSEGGMICAKLRSLLKDPCAIVAGQRRHAQRSWGWAWIQAMSSPEGTLGLRLRLEQGAELRLIARAARMEDQPLGSLARDSCVQVLGDHREHHVDAGGGSGGSQAAPVFDEERIGIDVQRREVLRQLSAAVPMGGDATSVEQSERGQHKGACADGAE